MDGTERMGGPLPLRQYTIATLPDPALFTGAIIWVTDNNPSPIVAYSDGEDWRLVKNDTVVS